MIKESLTFLTEVLRLLPRSNTGPPGWATLLWRITGRGYKEALRRAEDLDSHGLAAEALPHLRRALVMRPRSTVVHLKLGTALLKLGRRGEAKESLALAKFFARNAGERLEVLKLEWQLKAHALDRRPSRKRLEKLLDLFELVESEAPKDAFYLGAFVAMATFAVAKLGLGKVEREELLRRATFCANLLGRLHEDGSGYVTRYRERALRETMINLTGDKELPVILNYLNPNPLES